MSAFRLCVDLNVWVKQFLAEAKGLSGTPAQRIVQAVLDGRSGIGPLQLVVSHTMLSRLHAVMMRKGVDVENATQFVDTIANFAILGPASEYPRMVLGGGVQPTREAVSPSHDPYDPDLVHKPYDPEDGRVLDTAIAGRATALVTNNFKDFAHHADEVVGRGRVHIRKTAGGDLWIVHEWEMARWLETGRRPSQPSDLLMRRRTQEARREREATGQDHADDDPQP